ncbi:phage major tail tube protein [Rhodoplanes sp. TEM]|uniref:Phage major tail tube protein n=1 Tax=Rhodoplanes tepidamans TaxID=200616 RepID=A0ABT5JCY7_RHOTP|nr:MULTISPECIES: phage major tail tube protein [Rhodoplanes]MDC7787373.1 phage major tail tube protein [Rhodoplanes tepidamans]MDC7984745.1 phage major tail tube protein [Rhodoplanes sp. TEM]MDQ0358284.1 phage tail tube protein FII [Rhodoplanes tepidamans]
MEHVRLAGNLYCEGINTFLSLKRYKLPFPKVKTENHLPGGGVMDIEVPLGAIEPLVLSFDLIGANPQILGQFGMRLGQRRLYTIYELITDEKAGTKRERIITMRGLFSEGDAEEMSGRGLKGYGYQIKSITDYEDVIEGHGIIAAFSFWTNRWQGYGTDIGSEENRILRISG